MRHIYFLLFSIAGLILFYTSLKELAGLSLHNELYSHFLLIPVISAYFFVRNRKNVFKELSFSLNIGPVVVLGGLCFLGLAQIYKPVFNQNDYLSTMMLAGVICFAGGFILFYGTKAFRHAIFPLLFLIFIIPIPTPILDPFTGILVKGSAQATEWIFAILDVPFFREGFIFELPGVAIEVAEQCSGIRSTLALLITGVLAGYLFLETGWRKVVLCLCVFPITVFKNALRISTLALLASYVDPSWITSSWLHRFGGKPFFILALLFFFPVLWLLRRSERKKKVLDDN